jgi:hypothetical protein
VPFVAGDRFSVADITAVVTVDFATKALDQAIPDGNSTTRRWVQNGRHARQLCCLRSNAVGSSKITRRFLLQATLLPYRDRMMLSLRAILVQMEMRRWQERSTSR